MSTLLTAPPATINNIANTTANAAAGQRLRTTMAATRLLFTWFGTRKSLSNEQKSQVADTFGAEGDYLSAGKKLLDTSHPAFKAVTAVRARIIQYWKAVSLPYPEPAVRLIRQDDIDSLMVQLTTLKAELAEAVAGLESHYTDLQCAARALGEPVQRGRLPGNVAGLVRGGLGLSSVEPPQ